MTTVTKEEKRTTNQQKQTRNRRRNNNNSNIKENIHGDSRGRRKGGENLKKRELPATKPVIGSSNPFFIAVCAPETYLPNAAPNLATAVGVGPQRVKANVFLRARPRTSSYSYNNVGSNHFIHHPTLQQSRHVDVPSTVAVPASLADTLSSSDLSHFPSLGGAKAATTTTVAAAAATVKLNFKEMMMRGAAASAAASPDTPVAASIPVTVPVVVYSRQTIYQKQLSSGNIFSAAFHSPQDGEGEGDGGYGDGDGDGGGYESTIASSVLIDSCDNKYDRLYR